MTTPSGQNPGGQNPGGPVDPYTGQPIVDVHQIVPEAPLPPVSFDDVPVERHPLDVDNPADFGMTARAIPEGVPPEPPIKERAFVEPPSMEDRYHDNDHDSAYDHARRAVPHPHISHPSADEAKEQVSRWSRKRMDRGTDAGIWVPLGFLTIAFALFLGAQLFDFDGGVFALAMVLMVIALVLAAAAFVDFLVSYRRRRELGQDSSHAAGFE